MVVPDHSISVCCCRDDFHTHTSRHGADERVDEGDLGKHVEVNANRDQLHDNECVLRDEKKDCSGMKNGTRTSGGTTAHI